MYTRITVQTASDEKLSYSNALVWAEDFQFPTSVFTRDWPWDELKGFTCLIQISTRTKDYIIDPFPLFSELYLLNKVTTNPAIVKVFHGSRNDILWLQRDFSIYIVNCFDTYFAAKMLKLPTLSLAYLIKLFIGIDIDKRHQLSDWRVRPLPESMKAYARCDTHFLLSIYDKLCTELTIAQQLDWIKDSNQAAELKQSHFQEQLAHQDLSTLDINDRGFSNNTHAAIGALPSNSLSSSPIKQVPPSNKNNFKSGSQTSSHGINKNNKPNPYLHNNKRSSK
eukprot:gene21676-28048_t